MNEYIKLNVLNVFFGIFFISVLNGMGEHEQSSNQHGWPVRAKLRSVFTVWLRKF